jgi:hypothetical protein
MRLAMAGSGNQPVPFTVAQDAGVFVQALLHLPPQTKLLGFGDRIPWSGYVELWSRITGIPAVLENVTVAEQGKAAPGGFGEEIAEMYSYMNDFGYHGGDPSVVMSSQVCRPQQAHYEETCTDACS